MISSFFSAFDQFRTMTPIDVVDILVVAYIIYRVMKLLKDTSAARLAKGILILVLIMLFASFLHLTMISWLLRNALSVGVFAVVVIFQPELRRLLEQIGKGNLSRMLIPDTDPDVVESMIVATVSACADMSRTKTGALIVFERKERLGEIIATGTRVDAAPSAELIKNIFFKNSPLHDGAMIVRAGRVCAAGCVLPLSGNQGLSRDLGTRHRAAIGLSEQCDALVVVVSEETSRGVPKGSQRVEITCLAKGPVIRAEAYAEDKYAGLDLALTHHAAHDVDQPWGGQHARLRPHPRGRRPARRRDWHCRLFTETGGT